MAFLGMTSRVAVWKSGYALRVGVGLGGRGMENKDELDGVDG